MKLKFLMLMAGIALLASCGPSYRLTDQSTVNDTIGVPSEVQTSFKTQYPTAADVSWSTYETTNLPVDWELTGWPQLDQDDYLATFNYNNDRYYAWFDSEGNWIGTAYAISNYKSLPSAINTTINDKFAGYMISSVNMEMQKDRMAYEIMLKNGDNNVRVLIDDNGNIIKQKTVTKE